MRLSLPLLLSLLTLTGCPKPDDCLDNAGASCSDAADTDSREIWAGENGYAVFEVTQGTSLLGALHIVTPAAPQVLKDKAALAGLQPGQEQWTWSAAAWPAGTLTLTRNLTLSLPTQGLSRYTDSPFPTTTSAVSNTALDGDDRLYRLSFADAGTVGWLRVDVSAGATTGLHWYKSTSAAQGPFLVVTEQRSLTMTPVPVSELPANAYTIHQSAL